MSFALYVFTVFLVPFELSFCGRPATHITPLIFTLQKHHRECVILYGIDERVHIRQMDNVVDPMRTVRGQYGELELVSHLELRLSLGSLGKKGK